MREGSKAALKAFVSARKRNVYRVTELKKTTPFFNHILKITCMVNHFLNFTQAVFKLCLAICKFFIPIEQNWWRKSLHCISVT